MMPVPTGMPIALLTLAQGAPRNVDSTRVLLWSAALILLVLVGAVVIMWIRRNLFAPPSAGSPGGIMDDLRRMRNEGQLTEAEYDQVRKNMAARLAKSDFGMAKPDPKAKPGAYSPDNPSGGRGR